MVADDGTARGLHVVDLARRRGGGGDRRADAAARHVQRRRRRAADEARPRRLPRRPPRRPAPALPAGVAPAAVRIARPHARALPRALEPQAARALRLAAEISERAGGVGGDRRVTRYFIAAIGLAGGGASSGTVSVPSSSSTFFSSIFADDGASPIARITPAPGPSDANGVQRPSRYGAGISSISIETSFASAAGGQIEIDPTPCFAPSSTLLPTRRFTSLPAGALMLISVPTAWICAPLSAPL